MYQFVNKQPYFQVLSFDVVLGSISVGIFAVTILEVRPNPLWWIILPMAVWTVYTLDHLIDGQKKKDKSSIYRHWIHYQNQSVLGILTISIGVVTAILSIVFLSKEIVCWGIGLSFLTLVYFGIHSLLNKLNLQFFPKELFIALFYITGIFLAPLVWYGSLPSYPTSLVIVFMFLLAWMESVTISYYDYEIDMADGFRSFTISFGKKATQTFIIIMLSFMFVLLSLFAFLATDQILKAAFIIELLICAFLIALILFPGKFKNNNLFRWIGEGVFFLPGCIGLIWLIQ